MTRDEVIALAREAMGTRKHVPPVWQFFDAELERFAALVAAHEREECAKVCDKHWDDNGQHCANAIRSRTYDER